MAKAGDQLELSEKELEVLSARWDKITYHTQGSPLEDLSISCLAKNTACKPWSRPSTKAKNDTLARYIYLNFDELREVEKLDLKAAIHLLDICENTMLFVQEANNLGGMAEISEQATSQRMRFVEEYGLYQDYPIALSNIDGALRDLCRAEGVNTLLDLMSFIDNLSDKAWLGGSYQKLQNVFAHGDESGLCEYFPYRIGHRGFHLTEALAFCLNRLKRRELNDILEYHQRRRKKSRFGSKTIDLPEVVESRLLPEVFECIYYFGRRQQKLMPKLYDSAYVTRELMFLNDPETEGILHWLLHLALGIFRPSSVENKEELEGLSIDRESKLHKNLKSLLEEV